jgi:hypothetical protein
MQEEPWQQSKIATVRRLVPALLPTCVLIISLLLCSNSNPPNSHTLTSDNLCEWSEFYGGRPVAFRWVSYKDEYSCRLHLLLCAFFKREWRGVDTMLMLLLDVTGVVTTPQSPKSPSTRILRENITHILWMNSRF